MIYSETIEGGAITLPSDVVFNIFVLYDSKIFTKILFRKSLRHHVRFGSGRIKFSLFVLCGSTNQIRKADHLQCDPLYFQ